VKLYLLRHGYAGDYIGKDQGAQFLHNPEDLARRLMPDGVDAANAIAGWMQSKDELPTVIYHSPVKRAAQTAKIIGKTLGVPTVEEQNLEISKPLEMVVKRLAADKAQKRVALVAHTDNIVPGLRALNWLSGAEKFAVDPIAMAELRILDIDRDSFTWDERLRVLPSDLGCVDYY
jgi:phosphohistidine phosphatase SixA